MDQDPAQLYTGLVAELYEMLASERASAETYAPFLDRVGTPALELACGSGWPLLDLVERGYVVEGLDASRDMLDRARTAAAQRGLDVTLHHGRMQSFALEQRYRAIFLAGASFTLLTSDLDAEAALRCMHAHLEPKGSVLVPIEIVQAAELRSSLGPLKEATSEAGDQVRVSLVNVEDSGDGQGLRRVLRYERITASGQHEVLDRDWCTRWWSQTQFVAMLRTAGFERVSLRSREGGPAEPDARTYVALAQRG